MSLGLPERDMIESIDFLSNDDREAVRSFFNEMSLPAPYDSETSHTDSGPLIPVSRYGFVVRILDTSSTNNLLRTNGHDMALQPLMMVPLEKGSIAVIPGVEVLPYDDHTHRRMEFLFLTQQTSKTGLKISDLLVNNVGVLPVDWQTSTSQIRFPTVLDYGSFGGVLFANGKTLSVDFAKAAWAGIQERTFAPVKDRLMKAWPEGQAQPNTEYLKSALSFCKDNANLPEGDPKKLLFPGWLKSKDQSHQMRQASRAAERYERRITDYAPAV